MTYTGDLRVVLELALSDHITAVYMLGFTVMAYAAVSFHMTVTHHPSSFGLGIGTLCMVVDPRVAACSDMRCWWYVRLSSDSEAWWGSW